MCVLAALGAFFCQTLTVLLKKTGKNGKIASRRGPTFDEPVRVKIWTSDKTVAPVNSPNDILLIFAKKVEVKKCLGQNN